MSEGMSDTMQTPRTEGTAGVNGQVEDMLKTLDPETNDHAITNVGDGLCEGMGASVHGLVGGRVIPDVSPSTSNVGDPVGD